MDLGALIGHLEATREAVRRAALRAHELRPEHWAGPAAEAFDKSRQEAQARCTGTLAALSGALSEAQRLRAAMSTGEALWAGAGSSGRW